MKSVRTDSVLFSQIGVLCYTVSLMSGSTSAAYANVDRAMLKLNNANAADNLRAAREDARMLRHEARGENRHINVPSSISGISDDRVRNHQVRNQRHQPLLNQLTQGAPASTTLFPGQVSPFRTTRPHSTYINDRGNTRGVKNGLSLDLSSSASNITVGRNLLDGSITLDEGATTKQIHAGSKVTAAEFAALNQKLATGSQGLNLDENGAATGGALNINLVTDDGTSMRASGLVVPANVSVTGDFARNADGLHVNKDLVNNGSIYAVSSNPDQNTAIISARDITNNSGALISSKTASQPLNLSLKAERDLNNSGVIESSGDLNLAAGNVITNQGTVRSDRNITLDAPEQLQVNNTGGTIQADNGAINIRSADYRGFNDSTVFGGNLISHDVNINSGQGTTNVDVHQISGLLNSKGTAVHVNTETDLRIGTQCLTGDPTYYSTADIELAGDITVNADLAIIAGGSIFTSATDLNITAHNGAAGADIYIVAGANVTPGHGEIDPGNDPQTLPGQPPQSHNSTSAVSFTGASATGGDVDLTDANTVNITASAQGGNTNSGNIVIAAFSDSGNNFGDIFLPAGTIAASGSGSGNNGNISVIGGTGNISSISIDSNIVNNGGTGTAAGTGNVLLVNAQPTTSDGQPITFGTNGSVSSGNTIVPSNTIQVGADVTLFQPITASGDVTIKAGTIADPEAITAGGKLQISALDDIEGRQFTANTIQLVAGNDVTLHDQLVAPGGIVIVAGGSVLSAVTASGFDTRRSGDAGDVTVFAGAVFTENANDVTITGASGAGNILLNAGAGTTFFNTSSTGGNGSAGNINFASFGKIQTPAALQITANGNGSGFSGQVIVAAGANTADTIIIGSIVSTGGQANTGNIYVDTTAPDTGSGNIVVSTQNVNFGTVTSGSILGATPGATSSLKTGDINNNANVTIYAGQNAAVGNISATGGSANTIDIVATGSTTFRLGDQSGVNTTGNLTAVAGATGAGGRIRVVNSGATGLFVINAPTLGVTDGDGSQVDFDAGTAILDISNFSTITVNGVGANRNAGSIRLSGGVVDSSHNMSLTATGTSASPGGVIDVENLSTNITVGTGNQQFSINAPTGSVTLHAGGNVNVLAGSTLNSDTLQLRSDKNNFGAGVTVASNLIANSSITLTSTGLGSSTTSGAGVVTAPNIVLTGTGSANLATSTNFISLGTDNNVAITEADDITVVGGSSTGTGSLSIVSSTGSITIGGNVSAGSAVTLTVSGASNILGPGPIVTPGTLFINSGTGSTTLGTAVAQLTVTSSGLVDIVQAGSLQVNTSTAQDIRVNTNGNLTIAGNVTADPITWLATGDILLSGNQVAGDGILMVAGGSIIATAAIEIRTSEVGSGGNVVLAAGANFTDNVSDVKINGPSATGGNIDFTALGSLAVFDTSSLGGGGSGGNITMMAFTNIANANGVVSVSPIDITTGGTGNGNNGNVVILADHNFGTAIDLGNGGRILTYGGQQTTGSVYIATAAPETFFPSAISKSDASYTGSFAGNGPGPGDIIMGKAQTDAADITVISGRDLLAGDFDSSSNAIALTPGTITVQAGRNLGVGVLAATAFAASSNGGTINVIGGTGTFALNGAHADSNAFGGGTINVTFNTSALSDYNFSTSALGGGASGAGGSFNLRNNGFGGIRYFTDSVDISGTGAGGHLLIDTTSGPNDGPLNIAALSTISTNGHVGLSNGTIDLTAASMTISGGALFLSSSSGTSGTGSINLTTTSGGITSSTGNSFGVTSGGSISMSVPGGVDVSGASTGLVTISAFGNINAAGVNFTANSTSGNNPGGLIQLSTNSGNITAGALSSHGFGTGPGGPIFVGSTSGVVTVGQLSTLGDVGGSINVSTNSSSPITTGALSTFGTSVAGPISVQNNGNGGIDIGGGVSANSFGAGGSININAGTNGDITFSLAGTTLIDSTGTGSSGGQISLNGRNILATNGSIDIESLGPGVGLSVVITTSATGGIQTFGHDLTINSIGAINLSGVGSAGIDTSQASGNSGSVTLSNHFDIIAPDITTSASNANSNGGNVSITGGLDIDYTITLGSVNTGGSGTGTGGDVSINAGVKTDLNSGVISTGNGSTGTAGDITIALQDTATNTMNDLFAVGATKGDIQVSNDSGSLVVNSVDGSTVSLSADFDLTLNTSVAGNAISLSAVHSIIQNDGTISGGSLSLTFATGPLTLDTAVQSFTANASGQTLTINNTGSTSITGTPLLSALTVNTTAGGDVTFNGIVNLSGALAVSAAGDINLSAVTVSADSISFSAANDISIGSPTVANGPAGITLTTTGGGSITEGVSGSISSTTGLTVNLPSGGTATLTSVAGNAVDNLTGTGSGSITLDNLGALNLKTFGATQSLTVTSSTSISTTQTILTTGNLTFNTPSFINNQSITGGAVVVRNLSGNLTIDAGSGGSITGTVPPAGTPGNPSSPPAVTFATKTGGNLTLIGDMALAGDVEMDNFFGVTTSELGSLFHGANNVTLNTASWVQNGTPPQITGNNFNINILAGGTIINTIGSVTFGQNVTLNGSDFAIVAANDIDISGATINLSNPTGNGGNLTLLAGFVFTPPTAGQISTQSPYTYTAAASSGDIIGGTATINTSSSNGIAGSVLAVANGGSIALGNIDASSTTSFAGAVTLIADQGIAVGNINANGPAGGLVTLAIATAQVVGTPVVTNGTLSGGNFIVPTGTTPATGGNITVGNISAGRGDVIVKTQQGSTINLNGTLSAHTYDIESLGGTINLTASNIVTALDVVALGGGGSITLKADNIATTGPLTLQALSTLNGGSIVVDTAQALTAGGAGANILANATGTADGGSIVLTSRQDITVNATGINAAGANGDGATIVLVADGNLTLNDTSFMSTISGNGTNSNGGLLNLTGKVDLIYTNSSSSPLNLVANGTGTGTGGHVVYSSGSQIPLFVGVPATLPKGAANYVTLTALGGTAGGDGGFADVFTTGNLTVIPSAIDAGPRGTGSLRGGVYSISILSGAPKGANLAILGDLHADGVGSGAAGSISLIANNKKAFVLNTGKAPKNGVQGVLTAAGGPTINRTSIFNRMGGVTVSTQAAVTAENLELDARGKGKIAVGKGVTITAPSSLFLTSEAGSIGKKPLDISTAELFVQSNATVNLNNTAAGTLTVDSVTAKSFELASTAGIVLSDDITTSAGDITVTAGGGTLSVAGAPLAVHLLANDGAITLNQLDTAAGDISLGTDSIIETAGTKGGNVTIAIGDIPKKPTNILGPILITSDPQGGQIYYNTSASVVAASGAQSIATAKNADVIFSSTSSQTIKVLGNVTVLADPPDAVLNHQTSAIVQQAVVGEQSPLTSKPLATSSIKLVDTRQSTVTPLDLSAKNVPKTSLSDVFGYGEGTTNQLIVDAAFHSDVDTGLSSFNPDQMSGITISGSQSTTGLRNGNVVFAPSKDTTIETVHGKVKLAANTVALLMESEDGLAVFNLHDTHKNSVAIESSGKRFTLSPGRHILISNHPSDEFGDVNHLELVQHRGLSKFKLNDSHKVYMSEFSIPSACFAVKPLQALMSSNHENAARLARQITKTTAVLMTLNPDRGDFVQYFKTRVTAMQR